MLLVATAVRALLLPPSRVHVVTAQRAFPYLEVGLLVRVLELAGDEVRLLAGLGDLLEKSDGLIVMEADQAVAVDAQQDVALAQPAVLVQHAVVQYVADEYGQALVVHPARHHDAQVLLKPLNHLDLLEVGPREAVIV